MGRPIDPRLLAASGAARRHLILCGVLAGGVAFAILAQAVLLGRVVAAVFMDGAGPDQVQGDLIALAGVIAVRAALMAAFEVIGHRGAARVMSDLRRRLAERLLGGGGGSAARRGGELATAAVQGVDALEGYLARYLPQLMLAVAVPLVALVWIVQADPTSAAIIAVTMPSVIIFMILIGLGARARATARWRALGDLGGHFLDVVHGVATLKAHNRAEAQVDTVDRVGQRLRRETMGTLRIAFLSALVLELAASLAVAMVAVVIGVRLAEGGMVFAVGFTVLLLAPEVFAPLRAVGAQFHASADGLAAADRIFQVLDGPHAPPPTTQARPVPAPSRIAFEGVHFAHPGRPDPVLTDFHLAIERGERVGLLGPSGAGKSTVAALLMGMLVPQQGRVAIDGRDLAHLDPEGWRARVAWVPQRARLFRGTVADNLRLGDPDADEGVLWWALEQAGAQALVRALPAGLQTAIGDGGRRLSAGETQRLALARAYVRRADVVVLDEPTAHLDPATAAEVAASAARLTEGRMALVISHRVDILAHVDRTVTLVSAPVSPRPTVPLGAVVS